MSKKYSNIIKYICFIGFFATASSFYGQVRIANSNNNQAAQNSSAFIDASSNTTFNGSTNVGKGLLFPRTDLTQFNAFGGTPIGIPNSYPYYYDGLVVYNTANSGVAGIGSTEGTLNPGYWFYENKTKTVAGGTWRPLSKAWRTPVRTVTSSYTLVNDDDGGFVYVDSGSAATITVGGTLPIGFHCVIVQQGTGQVTVAGSGVTMTTARGTKTRTQYSAIGIIKQTDVAGTITGDAIN